MSCCTNTYNLGCIYHCNQLSFGTADFGGTVVGVFTSGNIVISQSITVVEGEPLIFDMSLLNEEMAYTLTLYHDDEQISLTIDSVEYDCFSVKTTLIGDAEAFVPVPGCTNMCEEAYDPTGVAGDVFDYNNMHTGVAVDGVTIGGNGRTDNPLTYLGGGGGSFDCSDLVGCNISNLTNDSGYITSSALSPYLTSATAALTYQPIGSYLTTISGLNISLLTNDSGYITSSALSGYLTSASAALTYEPIITGGTTAQYWRGDKTWQTLDKTAVGLGNVENTALSTWAGSTNITTLGTVATGTWSATEIGATKGGTGLTSYATGDMIYASAANTLSKLAAGTNGHVLTLAAGVPTWAAASGGGWSLTGNAGTSGYPSNFIGTTDNQDVVFKRNNAFIFGLYASGIGVGINTADNKYIGVQGSSTGNPSTGFSFLGYGNYYTYTTNNYGFVQWNGGSKLMGIGVGTDGVTRIATGTSSGMAPAIYINDAFGGNGNVGIGGSPVTGAKLAVVSTTSGFLPPVMTTTQRDAISSPASGLMIYDSTVNKVSVYNGSVWKYLQYE